MTTKLMDEAIVSLRQNVPPDQQDDIARIILQITGAGRGSSPYVCTPEEEAELAESEAEADRGEFAPDAQVRAIWAKYGL